MNGFQLCFHTCVVHWRYEPTAIAPNLVQAFNAISLARYAFMALIMRISQIELWRQPFAQVQLFDDFVQIVPCLADVICIKQRPAGLLEPHRLKTALNRINQK